MLKVGVDDPEHSLSRLPHRTRNLTKGLVERQIVSNRVLPATLCIAKVWILVREVLVYPAQGQSLVLGAVDGLGNQARIGEGRFGKIGRRNFRIRDGRKILRM